MYQVGHAQSPQKDDPMFVSFAEAIRHALQLNSENSGDTVYAVWDITHIGDVVVVCLIYQDDIYKA
jgi:hypothetical protein